MDAFGRAPSLEVGPQGLDQRVAVYKEFFTPSASALAAGAAQAQQFKIVSMYDESVRVTYSNHTR